MTPELKVSDEHAAEMQTRCDIAYEGPWHYDFWDKTMRILSTRGYFGAKSHLAEDEKNHPAGEFIVHSRKDVPDLLHDRQVLLDENARLETQVRQLARDWYAECKANGRCKGREHYSSPKLRHATDCKGHEYADEMLARFGLTLEADDDT